MYRLGKKYKFELSTDIIYTGVVISEDEHQILIKTIRDEELILSKSEIRQSKLMEDQE